MPRKSALAVFALSAAALPALAQSDPRVVEDMLTRWPPSAPGHSTERTTPTVRAVPVGALRVMLERGLVMCPIAAWMPQRRPCSTAACACLPGTRK